MNSTLPMRWMRPNNFLAHCSYRNKSDRAVSRQKTERKDWPNDYSARRDLININFVIPDVLIKKVKAPKTSVFSGYMYHHVYSASLVSSVMKMKSLNRLNSPWTGSSKQIGERSECWKIWGEEGRAFVIPSSKHARLTSFIVFFVSPHSPQRSLCTTESKVDNKSVWRLHCELTV